ncbi:hypothetical protein BOX15_Mlig021122g3, partial [Macrostomum lignano]
SHLMDAKEILAINLKCSDHLNTIAYQCPECNYLGLRFDWLEEHVKQTHFNKCVLLQILECKACSMSTNSLSLLEQHSKLWHAGNVDYGIVHEILTNPQLIGSGHNDLPSCPSSIVNAMLCDSELAPRLRCTFSELLACSIELPEQESSIYKIEKSGAYNLPDQVSLQSHNLPIRLTLVRRFLGPERVRLSRERILSNAEWPQPPPAGLPAEQRRSASSSKRLAAVQAAFLTLHLTATVAAWHPEEATLLKLLIEQVTGRLFNSAILWCLRQQHAVDWFAWSDCTVSNDRPLPGTTVAMLFLGDGERKLRLRRSNSKSKSEITLQSGDLCLMDGGYCFDNSWQQRLESGGVGSAKTALVACFMCCHHRRESEVLQPVDVSEAEGLIECSPKAETESEHADNGAANSEGASSVPKISFTALSDALTVALNSSLSQAVSEAVSTALIARAAEAQEAACQVDSNELDCLRKDAEKSAARCKSSTAGLPQINLLQLMYMAHGPVEINLPGSYQLDRTKDGVHACISFMPSFLNRTVGQNFMESLKQDLAWKQLTYTTKDGKERQEPRLTCYVGPDFEYYGNSLKNCNDWNPKLQDLKEIVEKAVGRQFNACMCYMYRNGRDSLGWHCEKEKPLGEHPYIAAVSLGQARYLEFSRKGREDRYVRLRSAHGDLVVTEGAIEDLYIHRVPKDPMARRTSYAFSFRWIEPTHRSDVV